MTNKILLLLTQYKRNNLERQLESINNQTLKVDYLVVFQNENHYDITHLKNKYEFIHIKSDYNTKFYGRFSICLAFPVDLCIILDDDMILGPNCLKNYIDECIRLNGIIGGNGRIGDLNPNKKKLLQPPDVGKRNNTTLVDFVGHMWVFKKDWLYYMFSIKPYTLETGEDMHFCFSAKLLGNINSYVCKQNCKEDMSDITFNKLAEDEVATWKTPSNDTRYLIEQYFIDNYNLKMIEEN